MLKYIFYPLSYLLNWVPYPIRKKLAEILGGLFFNLIRFRRSVVVANLRIAFGESRSSEEINQVARENYTHYALVIMELIQSLVWTQEDFKKKTDLFWDPIKRQMAQGEGGLLLTSHLGNWEFAIQAVSAQGMPCDIIVKRQKGFLARRFFSWYRTRFGAQVIYETGTIQEIFQALAQKRFVVFVLDQFMGPPIGLPVKFFGAEAGTAAGLALISEKTKGALFTAYNYRNEKGKIQVYLEKVEESTLTDPNRVNRLYLRTQSYNDVLESQIRKHPSQWLWLHRRWKAFRGQSRWILSPQAVFAAFAILLGAFSSPLVNATPTGIELPPDPVISIPIFETDKPVESGVLKRGSKKQALPKNKVEKKVSVPVIAADQVPFELGERLVIDLTWLALPAGQGILEVRQGPSIQGRPTYHLWGNVLSSKMVDTIYHVDNTIESFVDQQGFIPYKFILSMFESAQKKETRVAFNHPQAIANYWSKRISTKWGDQNIDRNDKIVPISRDMFSALYYSRFLEYELNKKQTFWLYENGQNMTVELHPIAKEIVNSGVGVFQCWKIKVDVKLDNVLRPTGDLFMWLSDDSKKYLVKFDAKVKIGSLLGRLVSIRERT